MEEKNLDNKNNKGKIFGYSIWRIFTYFIIYSIIGFIVETIFGVITKGTLESRQSFLYGPFCAIYGLGAVIMIIILQYFNKNKYRLFIGGFIVGSIIEYLISLMGELIFHVKWWDYSNRPLNIGGRICVYYSIFWGFLAIYLMAYLNPKIDKFIEKIKKKFSALKLKVLIGIIICFLFFDFIISSIAVYLFTIRKVHEYNLNVENNQIMEEQYEKIYGNEIASNIIYKLFSDKKIIKTFPNLKIQDKDGNIIYFDDLVPNIKPYYYKFK